MVDRIGLREFDFAASRLCAAVWRAACMREAA